jgi:hypothetical protein
MPKISKEAEVKFERPVRKYTDAELSRFHGLVQRFYKDYTCDNGGVIRVLDRVALGVAFGALSKDGAVLWDAVEDRVVRYPEFENILDQWQSYKMRIGLDTGSRNYQKLQALDKMAEQMNVHD